MPRPPALRCAHCTARGLWLGLAIAAVVAAFPPALATPVTDTPPAGGPATVPADPRPNRWTAHPVPAGARLVVDGRLDEPAWRDAPAWTVFTTHLPVAGRPADPAYRTEVRLLVEANALVFGIRAADPDPSAIRAPLLRRDHVQRDQDVVTVLLDATGERRAAQFVSVNARGVVSDGLFIADRQAQVEGNDGEEDRSPDFDVEAAARRDELGWGAELRIPFAALRLPRARPGAPVPPWRLMVTRSIPRGAGTLLTSSPVPRDAISLIAALAPVDGLDAVAQRLRDASFLSVRTTAVVRSGRASGEPGFRRSSLGVDLTWRPRADWVVDATLHPDFSQVESDTPQLAGNTRFALSQVEKRAFFLESTDVLDLPLAAFYSRAVTDPRAGLRATWRGRAGDATALVLADDGGGLVLLPGPFETGVRAQDRRSEVLLVRGRWHPEAGGGRVTVGAVATGRDWAGGGRNGVAGADLAWRPDDATRLHARWLGASTTPGAPGVAPGSGRSRDGTLWQLGVRRQTEAWSLSAQAQQTSADFRNDNGFVEQAGVRRLTAEGIVRHGAVSLGGVTAHDAETYLWVEHREALAGVLPPGGAQTVTRRVNPGVWWTGDGQFEAWVHAVLDAERVVPGGRLHAVRGVAAHVGWAPAPWITRLLLEGQWGDRVDVEADRVGRGAVWTADARWRASLPVSGVDGPWGLEMRQRWQQGTVAAPGGGRALTDTAWQSIAVLHLDGRHALRVIVQGDRTVRVPDPTAGLAAADRRVTASSLVAQRRLGAGRLLAAGVSRQRASTTAEARDPGPATSADRVRAVRREVFVSATLAW